MGACRQLGGIIIIIIFFLTDHFIITLSLHVVMIYDPHNEYIRTLQDENTPE